MDAAACSRKPSVWEVWPAQLLISLQEWKSTLAEKARHWLQQVSTQHSKSLDIQQEKNSLLSEKTDVKLEKITSFWELDKLNCSSEDMVEYHTPIYFLEGAEKLFHQRQGFSNGAVGGLDVFPQRGTEHLIRKCKTEKFRAALIKWGRYTADHFLALEDMVTRLELPGIRKEEGKPNLN